MTERDEPEIFRLGVREWLAQNMPRSEESSDALSGKLDWGPDGVVIAKALQRKLFEGGFAGLLYPKEYGGQGLGREYQDIFNEEARNYELPLTFTVTLGNVGPTILDFGTEEQKSRYIPAMLRGDELWVQFLSETGSGSDLASVSTSADRDGDLYVLNGSKIWSSGAEACDLALCLVRTNWDVPKHRGLSVVVVPISSPGLTISPVRLSNNASNVCQEFLDDVAIPVTNRLGDENDGWSVATRLLMHERNMHGGISLDGGALRQRRSGSDSLARLEELVASIDGDRRVQLEELVGEARMLSRLVPFVGARVSTAIKSGELTSQAASMLKFFASTSEYRIAEISNVIAGMDAVAWNADGDSSWGESWVAARRFTIGGGTMEMQRNVIAERVLGLPRDVSPDVDIPFRLARRNVQSPANKD
jgi:alkylation response protein AidB-like acyl-CoA dehydrogenase